MVAFVSLAFHSSVRDFLPSPSRLRPNFYASHFTHHKLDCCFGSVSRPCDTKQNIKINFRRRYLFETRNKSDLHICEKRKRQTTVTGRISDDAFVFRFTLANCGLFTFIGRGLWFDALSKTFNQNRATLEQLAPTSFWVGGGEELL